MNVIKYLNLMFGVGLAAVVTGVALVSIPAALVVGGSSLSTVALLLARGGGS